MNNNHDHSAGTHSMTCPVDGCDHTIEVHAHSDEEAVGLLVSEGEKHFSEVHPDAKGMTDEEKRKMAIESMKKH